VANRARASRLPADPRGARALEAAYVIGADGAHSTVRHAAGIDFPGNPPALVGFVADVKLAEPVDHATYFWRRDVGLAAVMPMPGDAYRVFGVKADEANLSSEQVRVLQAEPLTLEELRTSLEHISGTDLGIREALWLSKSSNSSRYAQRYRDGRILLVGDAAHVHLSAGGQGLNVGLQDATNLAWKLAAEIQGWAPTRLISGPAAYEPERRDIAARHTAPWSTVSAALIRPDGHVAHATDSTAIAELADAIATWTRPGNA
jgi:2-polyprenyl-6-methoxyphenol hydroxylase-like FAD-dependent oxidoreductase